MSAASSSSGDQENPTEHHGNPLDLVNPDLGSATFWETTVGYIEVARLSLVSEKSD